MYKMNSSLSCKSRNCYFPLQIEELRTKTVLFVRRSFTHWLIKMTETTTMTDMFDQKPLNQTHITFFSSTSN